MSFRDNLLYLRDARNMTQEQLAMLLGVTRQAVSKWESGASTPDMDRLVRLCEIFEVDLDDLIRGDVTAQPVDQALAIPPDTPVTDVTGYDPHMRGRALFIAGGAAFAIFGIAGVAMLLRGGVQLLLPGGNMGAVLNPYPFYFLLTGAAGALGCLAVAHIRHVAFARAHPFVSNFYTDDDHVRARRLSAFSRGAAWALAALWGGYRRHSEHRAAARVGRPELFGGVSCRCYARGYVRAPHGASHRCRFLQCSRGGGCRGA